MSPLLWTDLDTVRGGGLLIEKTFYVCVCVVDVIKFLFSCSWYCCSVVLVLLLVSFSCEGSCYLERVPVGAEPVYDVLSVSVVVRYSYHRLGCSSVLPLCLLKESSPPAYPAPLIR